MFAKRFYFLNKKPKIDISIKEIKIFNKFYKLLEHKVLYKYLNEKYTKIVKEWGRNIDKKEKVY